MQDQQRAGMSITAKGKAAVLDSQYFQNFSFEQCQDGAAYLDVGGSNGRITEEKYRIRRWGGMGELSMAFVDDCKKLQLLKLRSGRPCDDYFRFDAPARLTAAETSYLRALADGANNEWKISRTRKAAILKQFAHPPVQRSGSQVRCAPRDPIFAQEFAERFQLVRAWLLKWAAVGRNGPLHAVSSSNDTRLSAHAESLVCLVQLRVTDSKVAKAMNAVKGAYGAARRRVTNLAEVVNELRFYFGPASHFALSHGGAHFREVRVSATDGMTLREQIRLHHDVDVFIFAHGAGMVQMTWMQPGSLALELSRGRYSPEIRVITPPTTGAAILAEGARIHLENVWVTHHPICLYGHETSKFARHHQSAVCQNFHAAVNVSAVVERVRLWWERRREFAL